MFKQKRAALLTRVGANRIQRYKKFFKNMSDNYRYKGGYLVYYKMNIIIYQLKKCLTFRL